MKAVDRYMRLAKDSDGWNLCLDLSNLEESGGSTFSIRSYVYANCGREVLLSRVSVNGGDDQIQYILSPIYSENRVLKGLTAKRIYELVEAGKATQTPSA